MGLPDSIFERTFKRAIFSTPHKKLEFTMEKPFAATIDRKRLSEWMLKEAERIGAEIEFGFHVSKVGNNYVIANGEKIYFDFLIGADGSSSIVRSSLCIPTRRKGVGIQYWVSGDFKDMEVYFDSRRFGPWYAWIAPHSQIASIGTGGNAKLIGLHIKKKNLDSWCMKKGIDISSARFEGAEINSDYRGYRFGNRFLVGDAAGLASGFTGEGIYFAMASGEDIARIIINRNHEPLLINKILAIKRKHEITVDFLTINRVFASMGYDLLLSMLKSRFLANRIIDLVT
jgi:geranylgeranyl reductase